MAGNTRKLIDSRLTVQTTVARCVIGLLLLSGMSGCAQSLLRPDDASSLHRVAADRLPVRIVPSQNRRTTQNDAVDTDRNSDIGGWSGPDTQTKLTGIVIPADQPATRPTPVTVPQFVPRAPTDRRSPATGSQGNQLSVIPGPVDRRRVDRRSRDHSPESPVPAPGSVDSEVTMTADPITADTITEDTRHVVPSNPAVMSNQPDSVLVINPAGAGAVVETEFGPTVPPSASSLTRQSAPDPSIPDAASDDRSDERHANPGADVLFDPKRIPELRASERPTRSVSEDSPSGTPADPPVSARDSAAAPSTDREPSMLNRIRDFYTPRTDENAGDLLRKQFRRLQSPWGLLRDKPAVEDPPLKSADSGTGSTALDGSVDGPRPDAGTQHVSPDQPPTLQLLIDDLQQQLKNWPRDESGRMANTESWRQRQTDLRLLQLVAGHSAEAMSVIEGLPEEEQEFWQSLMMSLTYYRGAQPDQLSRNNQLLATSEELRAAVRHIQALSPLRIRRMEFCSAINGFGSVDAFPTADFSTGQPVLIYVEVENFRSHLTESGTYHTEFTAALEILRDDQLIESIPVDVIADDASTRRTDFFLSFDDLTIPAHLNPGQYSVRLKLRDQVSRQQADASLPFNVR